MSGNRIDENNPLFVIGEEAATIVSRYIDGRVSNLVEIGGIDPAPDSVIALKGFMWSAVMDRGDTELEAVDHALGLDEHHGVKVKSVRALTLVKNDDIPVDEGNGDGS